MLPINEVILLKEGGEAAQNWKRFTPLTPLRLPGFGIADQHQPIRYGYSDMVIIPQAVKQAKRRVVVIGNQKVLPQHLALGQRPVQDKGQKLLTADAIDQE